MDGTKFDIGQMLLNFKGLDLGHTIGGATVTIGREVKGLGSDQFSADYEKVIIGQMIKVETQLAEHSVDRLNSAMPEGQHALGVSGERLGIGVDSGYGLRQDSGLLIMHPARRAANDTSRDVHVYKAVSTVDVSLAYKKDEQFVIPVTFEGLVDETYGDGRRLGHVGSANIS